MLLTGKNGSGKTSLLLKIEEFLKVIDSCTGRVELITDDGDRLNLKSKLCQLVSLSTIFSSAAKIPEMEIVAHELEDSKKIMDYLMGC